MRFRTRGIGYQYNGAEGKEGHRRAALGQLEQHLQGNYQTADRLRSFARGKQVATGLPPIGGGRVKALARFHEKQQSKEVNADKQDARVIRIRQWLHRQNASLTPEGKIIWPKSKRVVVYDHQLAARNLSMITIDGGRLCTANGRPLNTRNMVTHFSGPGCAIYVVSEEGNLHVSSHSVGHRHHSSLLAGGVVAGAGELRVKDGRLNWISNKSGHYQPDVFDLYQTLKLLESQGVQPNFQIYLLPQRTLYQNMAEFMNAQGAYLEPQFLALQVGGPVGDPGDGGYINYI
jgi:hypothetical protein